MHYLHEIIYVQCALQVTICALQVIFKLLPTEHTHHGKKFLYIICLYLHVSVCSVASDSFPPHGVQPARLLCPPNFPGKKTTEDCHFLLQGIFTNTWIQQASPATHALAGGFFTTTPRRKPYIHV